MSGMQRTYNLVIEHALVIVHIRSIVGVEAIQVFGQLGQVVGTAGFVQCRIRRRLSVAVSCRVGVHAQHLCIRLAEHFAIAHASGRVGIASLNHLPEVESQIVVVRVPISPIASQGARNLWNVLVGMAGADVVDVL